MKTSFEDRFCDWHEAVHWFVEQAIRSLYNANSQKCHCMGVLE